MRWIRSSFLDTDWEFGKLVVHGHSISDDVVERPNRLGIDTGAFATGRLTALGLEGADRWFITASAGDRVTAACG
jgi:serine/threonine protein phosphatase 1